jgi:hypothetical protein
MSAHRDGRFGHSPKACVVRTRRFGGMGARWITTMPLRGLSGFLVAFAPLLAIGLVAVVLALRAL